MPLTGSGPVLAVALAAAGGILDPVGILKSAAVANALVSWFVTNTLTNNILPANMVAAGTSVTGFGAIGFIATGDDLGTHLAAAVPATDTAGIAKWKVIGNALRNHHTSHGQLNPAGFIASPTGGAVTGQGAISYATTIFSPTLATAMGFALGDLANQATWLAIGAAILLHISTNADVAAFGYTSPIGGGPLVGASLIT